jgi:hypothetical protein
MAHNQEEVDHHHLYMANLTDHYEEATWLEKYWTCLV